MAPSILAALKVSPTAVHAAAKGPGGIDRYGASAPAPDLYEYFGLTAAKITGRVLEHIKQKEIA